MACPPTSEHGLIRVTPSGKRARWSVGALVVLGLGLVLMPFVFQMFTRAPQGADMIAGFRPYMTATRLSGYQIELREIGSAVREGGTSVATALSGPPTAADLNRFATRFPDFVAFEAQWGGIYPDMSGMMETIRDNLGNYEAVAALPNFSLFPWFFVAPGAILLGVLALGLVRPVWWRASCRALVVLGLGLVLAPVVFQMFSRAPAGGRMMNAFKTIETRSRVERIQGYFGDMAVGQGAVQLELVPALQRSGLSSAQISSRYPGITTFDDHWAHILNDMTPMIGTMSDNVTKYQAIAALPPFPLFPWFFVAPGLLVIGSATAAGGAGRARRVRDARGPDIPSSQLEGVK
jgi:hypothetical protein